MTDFEYISVLLSIILGLGITQLLSGLARLLRDGRALAPAWWIMLIVATLLVMHFQVWWVSFEWRHLPDWTFLSYLTFMILPMLLYLLAYLVLPGDLHLDGERLVAEFIQRRRSYYCVVALVPLVSLFQQHVFGQPVPLDFDTLVRLCLLVLAVPGFLSRRAAVQAGLAVAYALLLAVYIGRLFMQLR